MAEPCENAAETEDLEDDRDIDDDGHDDDDDDEEDIGTSLDCKYPFPCFPKTNFNSQSPAKSPIPEWQKFSLHNDLLRALHAKGFNMPTPIQDASLPLALEGRDVVGIAQTVTPFG